MNDSLTPSPDLTMYNSTLLAADSYNYDTGDKSWLDSASDALTLGTHGAFTSAVNSFINTGVTVANWFGAGLEEANTYQDLLDSDPLAAQYYKEHQSGVELAGFIAGSLIPGIAGLKAFNAAKNLGTGSRIASAAGLFSAPRDALIKSALEAVANGTPATDTILKLNKYKAIALGFGDQALQAAAWETSVAATMGADPVLSNSDWKDITFNIALGAVVGGTVGGIFEGLGIRGQLNQARTLADIKLRPFEATTNLGKGDYIAGDRIVALLDSIDKIPKPTTAAETSKQISTRRAADSNARSILNGISDDPAVSNALFDRLMYMKNVQGVSNDDLYMHLAQLNGVSRITRADINDAAPFYLNKGSSLEEAMTPTAPKVNAQAYTITTPGVPVVGSRYFDPAVSAVETGTSQYRTAKAAFDAGADFWIDVDSNIHVNPQSAVIKKAPGPGLSNIPGTEGAAYILNLKNGRITNTAVAILGDLTSEKPVLSNGKLTLNSGNRRYTYSVAEGENYSADEDYVRANARFTWADLRGVQKGDVIQAHDLPMLMALQKQVAGLDMNTQEVQRLYDNIFVKYPNGKMQAVSEMSEGLPDFIYESKKEVISALMKGTGKILNNGFPDSMDAELIAARTHTPIESLEAGFPKTDNFADWAPPASEVAEPAHAKLTYNIGDPLKDVDGMVARGMIGVLGRIARAKDMAENVTAKFFGKDVNQLPINDPELQRLNQQTATSLGAGPSFLGFANANYGSVESMWEAVGAFLNKFIPEKFNAVKDSLTPMYTAIANDSSAVAELGILQNAMRANPYKYVFSDDGEHLVVKELKDFLDTNNGLVPFMKNSGKSAAEKGIIYKIAGQTGEEITTKGNYAAYKISDTVMNWLKQNHSINMNRVGSMNEWYSAQGIAKTLDPDAVYFPPIDTRKYNFIAFVKEPAGNGASSSSVAAITALNESDFNTLITAARAKGFDIINKDGSGWEGGVFTKGDIKRYHEAKGDYDYNMNLVDNTVDSSLKRAGILSNYFPETRADKVLDDWMAWHQNMETRLARNMTELKYAQPFAELRDLGRQYTDLATSRAQNIGTYLTRTAENPYDDYIKTALNISKKGEYRLWADANEKVEAFFDSAFRTAKSAFTDANKGLLSYEAANKLTQQYGLGSPFVNAAQYMEAQGLLPSKPYLRNFIQGANSLLSATVLRLDFLQAAVNIISSPILMGAEVSSIKNELIRNGKSSTFSGLLTMPLPGGAPRQEILSTTRLISNSIGRWNSDIGPALIKEYQDLGIDVSLMRQHQNMMGELSFTGTESESILKTKFNNAVNIGEKFTGNKFAESFTRFCAADAMAQICDEAGITGAQKIANMRTFTNRVQGNYIASQRPVAFQGVLGQAMGLFQTYQFNLMQQFFRHIENGDTKTVATLLGLQSTLYGFQGLPLFAAVNTHIIGNAPGNPGHADIYSAIPQLVGTDVGNLLLYGGASWASGAALYSRGDINPRNITVLPINPADWPAIDGLTRFVKNVYDIGAKLADGGKFTTTMLEGLEHNSLSRPLAGLAQVVQGYSTTSQGNLISRTNEVGAIANAARLVGSKPVNEAIALDAAYRDTAYKAKDRERLGMLGEAVKTTVIGGGVPTAEQLNDFATKYAASGGRIENFNAFMVNTVKNTSQSKINQMVKNLNNPIAKNMMTILGGQPLPDFTNAPPVPGSKQDISNTQLGINQE